MVTANLILVCYIVFSVITMIIIIIENFFKSKESSKKNQVLNGEVGELKSTLQDKDSELRDKDFKVTKVNELLDQAISDASQLQKLKDQIANLEKTLQQSNDDSKAKDTEIDKGNEQIKDYEEKTGELQQLDIDLVWIKEATDEQKKNLNDMKQHMEENKMKMQLLNEKAKDGVELISAFAQGKEFDEFRKSIHLDELVQKYEEQIRTLKIKNMEIQKQGEDE